MLGWRLHRTRIVFASSAVGVLVQGFAFWGSSELVPAVQLGASMFYAVALVCFGFAGDRGLTTPSGVLRFVVLGVATALTAWFCLPEQSPLVENLYRPMVVPEVWAGIETPQVAVAVSVICGVLLAIQFAEKRGAIESAMMGALVAGECGIWSGITTVDAIIWFMCAQLILVLGLMEGFHSMAYQDELTGLPGRRALNELMDQLNGKYAICMVDVDHFKKFNDRYGHDAGDEVLRMIAGQLGQVGIGGRAFRYGGEEFTIVFPGKSAERVEDELERLRKNIAARPFVFRGRGRPSERPEKPVPSKRPRKTAPITVSMGLSENNKGHRDAYSVLKSADQNLYRAKDAGRNALIW